MAEGERGNSERGVMGDRDPTWKERRRIEQEEFLRTNSYRHINMDKLEKAFDTTFVAPPPNLTSEEFRQWVMDFKTEEE